MELLLCDLRITLRGFTVLFQTFGIFSTNIITTFNNMSNFWYIRTKEYFFLFSGMMVHGAANCACYHCVIMAILFYLNVICHLDFFFKYTKITNSPSGTLLTQVAGNNLTNMRVAQQVASKCLQTAVAIELALAISRAPKSKGIITDSRLVIITASITRLLLFC